MAYICSLCKRAHSVDMTCEQARAMSREIGRETEHHKQHCEGCINPLFHVLKLRSHRRFHRQRRFPVL